MQRVKKAEREGNGCSWERDSWTEPILYLDHTGGHTNLQVIEIYTHTHPGTTKTDEIKIRWVIELTSIS